MSEQSQPDSHQSINAQDTSIQKSNVGQVIGGNLTQIQGEVINVTVYDNVNVAGFGNRQASSSVKPLTQQDYRNRKVLLNKVKNFWIEGVLEKSLHVKALIELGLEERLDVVDRPFRDVQEIPDESVQTLPTGTDITDIFQMGEGRTLLILGEPGAGKTITLLKLTQSLINCAEKDESLPIPVVFNLSSWESQQQNIDAWLVEELNGKYAISKELGKVWIKKEQLLLLLDGLDEVKAERREDCVQSLNKFLQEYGLTQMVVCSRIRDYETLSNRLKLQGAICIQSLTHEQINQYLDRAGEQLEAVKTLLQEDTALQELAKSPLTLNVIALAYQAFSVEDLSKTSSLEERRQHLFNAYIERMFKRRGASQQYSKAKVMHWLSWLAQQMSQESQTIFLIERMQPSWLRKRNQQRLFSVGFGLTFFGFAGLITGSGLGLILWGVTGFIRGTTIGVLLGSTLGIFNGFLGWLWNVSRFRSSMKMDWNSIYPVETLNWSWFNAGRHLVIALPYLGTLALVSGLVGVIIVGQLSELTVGAIHGLTFGLIFCLPITLIGGLTGSEMKTRAIPNQGIWQSAKNAIVFALMGALVVGLAAGLMSAIFFGISSYLGRPIPYIGILVGLTFGLISRGGEASIKHFVLRVILYITGYIPWNYAQFLDYASDRIFLQKVGGGYIFIHRLLLEHFAQMEPEQVRR